MPLAILAVGKMSRPHAEAANEYLKRLSRYDKLQVVELPEEREPSVSSPSLLIQHRQKECAPMLRHLKVGDHVIALAIDGERLSSEAFADRLNSLRQGGKRPVFLIGGSTGLSEDLLLRADERLSLSSLTFPHQLARVLLLEQLYRAFKIINNERYHK